MGFTVSAENDHLVESVYGRVESLVSSGIWDIDQSRLNGWRVQFSTREERFLSACILDSLIYRSKKQFTAGLQSLYRQGVRWALSKQVTGEDDLDLVRLLQTSTPASVRLVPVICDHDPPTKSGPLVIRRLKKAVGITTASMNWPWKLRQQIEHEEISAVVFVDDFLGTGDQFCNFISDLPIAPLDTSVKWIYAPMVAHAKGIETVTNAFPRIEVVSMEKLGAEHNFFHKEYWEAVSDGKITHEDARNFYEDFIRRHGIAFGSIPSTGYGELALCFGFEHATPDNSLPLIWYSDTNWNALLER